jgi:hypothetical protein
MYRCECCERVVPAKVKATIKPVTLKFGDREVLTQENLCDVCAKGKELGIPIVQLKKMKGRPRSGSQLAKHVHQARNAMPPLHPPKKTKKHPKRTYATKA